jgi:hypothetical protein
MANNSPQSADCLKRASLPLIVAAHILSSGLYGLYWIMSRGHCVYFSRGNTASKVFYWAVVLVIGAHFTFLFGVPAVTAVDQAMIQISFTTVFLSTIVMTALVAIIAAGIAKRIGPVDAGRTISISAVVALTLLGFTSALYLQYWINKSK